MMIKNRENVASMMAKRGRSKDSYCYWIVAMIGDYLQLSCYVSYRLCICSEHGRAFNTISLYYEWHNDGWFECNDGKKNG